VARNRLIALENWTQNERLAHVVHIMAIAGKGKTFPEVLYLYEKRMGL
jgi:hypothetical protein